MQKEDVHLEFPENVKNIADIKYCLLMSSLNQKEYGSVK